jgi:hypothetical protein
MSTKPLTKTPTLKRSRGQAEEQDNNYETSSSSSRLIDLIRMDEDGQESAFSYSLVSPLCLKKKLQL